MGDDFVQVVLTNTVALTVPLLWAALGEAIIERAGVINVGIEGVMIIGAFAAAGGLAVTESVWGGVLFAAGAGFLSGLVLAFLYVYRGTDQIVTGLMFTLMALSLTTTMYEKWLASPGQLLTFDKVDLPLLSEVPLLGPALFGESPLGYGALIAAVLMYFVLKRTWFGLSITAGGERPEVADSAGISVHRLRWIALGVGCLIVAIGGASLILDQSGSFVPGATGGIGFIALAVVVLARWNPLFVILSAGLFGFTQALQNQLQTVDALGAIPNELWLSLPYIVTIVVVAFTAGGRYPAGVGLPFKGKLGE